MPKSTDNPSDSQESGTMDPHATAVSTPVTAPITTTPVVPVTGTTTTASTSVALSSSSPSTTTTAPTSSVSVTVPNTTGTVTFSLVVTDNLGVESQPAYATVTIQGPPTAVLTATPATVTEGGAIELSGSGSTSSGSIASYKFSFVPATIPVPIPTPIPTPVPTPVVG